MKLPAVYMYMYIYVLVLVVVSIIVLHVAQGSRKIPLHACVHVYTGCTNITCMCTNNYWYNLHIVLTVACWSDIHVYSFNLLCLQTWFVHVRVQG